MDLESELTMPHREKTVILIVVLGGLPGVGVQDLQKEIRQRRQETGCYSQRKETATKGN